MPPLTTDTGEIWAGVLEIVRGELNEPVFKTWFENAAPVELTDDGVFVVGVQSEFAREWFESRYSSLLKAALSQSLGSDLGVRIVVDKSASSHAQEEAPEPALALDEVGSSTTARDARHPAPELNRKYTFESFVIGESNRFARQAALAVAEAPGLAYNPLFIYGGPGLGKTHLLHAIGHYVSENFPHKRVVYVSSERFTNDFINSIANSDSRRIDGFRQRYRKADVLLVDDVQFLKGKERIQEEFFHTFNTLQQAGKAVVLSSDRPPKDIDIEERLRSRFAMGLITDIQLPDLETRVAILKRWVHAEGIHVDDDVLMFVAEMAGSSSIREMEGAMIRIIAHHRLFKRPIDRDIARDVAKDVFPEQSTRPISIASIQREVSRYFSVSHSELVGSKRTQAIVYPRQIAMYLARELTDLSLPKIGEEFGGRDHTTVMHATAKIQKLMTGQREVYNQVQALTNAVKQRG
jgi:chromosomal replication initiator protein